MCFSFFKWPLGMAAFLTVMTLSANAAPVASCNPAGTQCSIPEDLMFQLPFTVIAGDAVLLESNGTTVSHVFRIFNNVINTGAGTGLGNLVELFSADAGSLPLPTNYSANVVYISENASGITSYTSSGVTYLLGAPEPQSLALFSVAGVVLLLLKSKDPKRSEKGRGL